MRLMPLFFAAVTAVFVPALISADCQVQEKNKDAGKSFVIPFRLTDAGHILVRAKIDGKEALNFIVDTGAPLLIVCEPAAKKLGLEVSKKGESVLKEFQVEGGPVNKEFKCIVETPFQLEGMNALGIAGAELHGMIGYTYLAQFKMEIDLTKDAMIWTKLDFQPPAPQRVGEKGDIDQLDALAKMMKSFAALLGKKGPPVPVLRGFIGFELTDKEGGVFVQSVLAKSPAAIAGVTAGDRIIAVDGKEVTTTKAMLESLAKITSGQEVRLIVHRGEVNREITITAGEGM